MTTTDTHLEAIRQLRHATVNANVDFATAEEIGLRLRVAERHLAKGQHDQAADQIREAEEALCAATQNDDDEEDAGGPSSMRQAEQGYSAPDIICQHCGDPIEQDDFGDWTHEGNLAYCRDNNEEVGDRIQRAEPRRVLVQATVRHGGTEVVYTAWESSSIMGPHHTITHIDGECFGKIGTLRMTGDELRETPWGSSERWDAVFAHADRENARAIEAILSHHPRLHMTGTIDGAEIREELGR